MSDDDVLQPDPAMERDGVLPPTLRSLASRWLLRLGVAAFVLSVILHLVGALTARFITFGDGTGAVAIGGRGDGPVEMAIISESELKGLSQGSVDVAVPSIPTEVSSTSAQVPSLSDAGPSDPTPVSLGDVSDMGALSGGGDVTAGGEAGSLGGTGGQGGGGGTSFFGVEASGTRFAFIVDISASMEGQKIARLKQELRDSIDRMPETNEFVITTFSDKSEVVGGRKEWREASPAGRRKVYPLIEAFQLGPNTQPLPAFKIIFGDIRPRPDAIYFMTDGEFDESVVQEVAIFNAKLTTPIPIHCICFASQSGEVLMKKIAQQSKGTYTFVPGPP